MYPARPCVGYGHVLVVPTDPPYRFLDAVNALVLREQPGIEVLDQRSVIVESAKVEVSFLKVTGALRSTDFLPQADEEPADKTRRQMAAGGMRAIG